MIDPARMVARLRKLNTVSRPDLIMEIVEEAASMIEQLARANMTYDYDRAPTDPRHGGKLTAEMIVERMKALEDALRDLAMLERVQTPDMSGKRRTYAFMQNGKMLAECLDKARELLGMEPR